MAMIQRPDSARRHLLKREAKRWRAESGEAIASINAFIERHGLLASKLRYRPRPDEANSSSPS